MISKKGVFILECFFLVFFLILFGMQFISANSIATGVYFQGNVTPDYDEGGALFINWTAAGSAAGNYSVYLWMNNNFVNSTTSVNNSATGYSRGANTTEANYTFTIEAITAANYTLTNATNVSIYIDRTLPVITLPNYVNSTIKKNTDKLILNVSITDAKSGLTGAICLVDVNGTNQSIAVDNGWCNSTNINLNNLSEGNHLINVYVNDTVGNVGLNNSYIIVINTHPPSNLVFSNNVTADYDEGTFKLNWTSGGLSNTVNYTIYIYNGTTHYASVPNNSAAGYSFSTTLEGNYTFIVQVANATITANSTSNISMYVDRTAPLVNWTSSGYSNLTYKKNTDRLTLNISVGDASSGGASGNSYCVFSINETNETVAVSNGWCNTTYLNLTNLADGNHTIDIWANDTVNKVGVNLSFYVVWVDTTTPTTPTFSCTPTTVFSSETITCSCSGTDASSGVNATTYTENPLTIEAGTYETTCTVTDNAGNSNVSAISYVVGGIKSSGSSGSVASAWKNTYIQDDKEFSEKNQINQDMSAKSRIKIKLNGESHYVGLISLTSTAATVNVSSVSQQKIMSIGEEWKVEVTGDNYYDVLVKLNEIELSKANITLNYIHELISIVSEENLGQGNQETTNESTPPESTTKNKMKNIYYYIGGAIIVLIAAVLLILRYRKKPSYKVHRLYRVHHR
jgi:hypothetical protein